MAVTEVLRGLGSWSLQLSPATPKRILRKMDFFGHIAINTGKVDPRVAGDALLRSSRYVGVYRAKKDKAGRSIAGVGMAFWLGDHEDKGDVIETLVQFTNSDFDDTIRALLPNAGVGGAVIEGTISNTPTAFTGTVQYSTRRKAIDYICQTKGADWRVNGDGTLDAGLESELFQVIPKAALIRRSSGKDMFVQGFSGAIETAQDVEDFTTRTLLLAQGQEAATVTATADISVGLNPFKDLRGNAVKLTRIVSESDTDTTNAQARAQLQLNRFSGSRDSIGCSTNDYDLKGTVVVGDYMWVFDPDAGVQDTANEINFMGERIYPLRLRLVQMDWPVASGMSVAFRTGNGEWIDLTEYVEWEGGASQLTVGGYSRSLVGPQDSGPAGGRPVADTSVPAAPTWNPPFTHSVYQSARGESRAQVQLRWNYPNNVDGSTIIDGSHFELRFRSSSTPIFPSTHAQMSAFTHNQLALGTHEQPISYTPGPYEYRSVPWDQNTFLLQDLPTNMPFEVEVRAVDSAKPPNAGEWSAATVFQTSADTLPPATPAPPLIAAGRLSVQMTHTLGRADGGTYNLDPDLNHFELHGQYEPLFTPSDSTMLGKVSANNGMILGHIPAVGSVKIDSVAPVYYKVIAVDNDGNKSPASSAVQATVVLLDSAYISELTVSKVSAGTITASWLNAGTIWSGTAGGARTQMVAAGFEAYNSSNVRTVFVESATGNATITGLFQSGLTGRIVTINPTQTTVPEIWFYVGTPIRRAFINSLGGGSNDIWLGLNSGSSSDDGVGPTGFQTSMILAPTFSMWSYNVVGGAGGPFGARRGGWISVNATDTYMGWNNDSTSTEWHYRIEQGSSHYVRGRYAKNDSAGGTAGLYVDQIGGSGTNQSVSYGATMLSTPNPIVDIQPTSGGAAGKYHCISSRSATSFNVEYPAGNCDIFIWAYRIG